MERWVWFENTRIPFWIAIKVADHENPPDGVDAMNDNGTPELQRRARARLSESDGLPRSCAGSPAGSPVLKRPLVQAGIVLGLGFGGFADGIVLHQILGWHHLVCVTAHCQPTSIQHLQLQNTQDGYFHLALWLVSLIGTAMLFRAGQYPGPAWNGRVLLGSMLAGWGLFNLVEGIVDHHILGIHHVLPGHPHQLGFDMLFLAAGVVLLLLGARLIRSPRPAKPERAGR